VTLPAGLGVLLAAAATRAGAGGTRTAAVAVFTALAADIRHMAAILTDRFATLLADGGHVLAILAYRFAAFAAGFAGFFRGKLMGVATFVRCTSTLARNLALPRFVHAGESASATLSTAIVT
jgi:hypothetical protein